MTTMIIFFFSKESWKNTTNFPSQPGGDFASFKKSLLLLKEATKCRQYEPQENVAMMGYLLKTHSQALSSILKS